MLFLPAFTCPVTVHPHPRQPRLCHHARRSTTALHQVSSIFYAPCEDYLPLPLIHSLVCVIKTARPAAGRHMRAKDSPTSSTTSTSPMSPTSQMSPTSPIRANAGMQPRPPGSVPISRPGTASISRVDPHCATWHPGVRSTSMFSGSCKAIHGVPALFTAGRLHIG